MVVKVSNIPNRLKNPSKEHPYVAGAVDIVDDALGKPQSQVNQERIQEENTLDGKIATEKQRAEGIESGLEGRLETVEGLAEISVGGGDIQIATGADFDSPDATKRAKAVTVGAMLDGMINSPVFDLSAYTGDSYASLDAALTVMNAAGFPSQLKKGGMTLKFVQSSDNNYVQFRYTSSSTSVADFTNVTNWQGVDDEPIAGSENLVKSGGFFRGDVLYPLSRYRSIQERDGAITPQGDIWNTGNRNKYKVIPVSSSSHVKVSVVGSHYYFRIALASEFDYENSIITLCDSESLYEDSIDIDVPSNAKYVIINIAKEDGTYYDISEFIIDNVNILYLTKVNANHDTCFVDFADKNNMTVLNEESLKYVNQDFYGFDGIESSVGHLDTTFIIKSMYPDARYKVIKIENTNMTTTVKVVGDNSRTVLLSDYVYDFDDTQNYIYATGETGRRIGAYEKVTDAKYILVQTKNYQGTDVTPEKIILNGINILNIVDVNKAVDAILSERRDERLIGYTNDSFNTIPIELIEGDIDRIKNQTGHLDRTQFMENFYPSAKFVLVPVAGDRTLTLTATIPRFVILSDDTLVDGQAYPFADGETARRDENVTSLNLPHNARFVAIQMVNYEGRDCGLSALIVGDVDYFHYVKRFDGLISSVYPSKIYGVPKIDSNGMFDIDAIDSFFKTEIDDTISKVLELMTEPCLCFPLITDIHYMAKYSGSESTFPQNLRNSTKIMRHLASILPIDFVLNLGDNIDATNYSTQEMKQQCLETHQLFNEIGVNYLFAVGNHDLPVGVSNLFKYNIFSVRDAIFDTNSGFTNYYIDTHVNIRVIVVNAYCQNDYSIWLSNALDSNKINILCIHLSPLSNQNWDNNTFTYASNITTVLTSFVNNGGTLIQLFGHTHADFYFDSPWLSISTGCAQFVQPDVTQESFQKITGYEGSIVAPARTYTDATQQLFDIVVVRPNARKVNMIRFGAGSDREFSF